MPEIVCIKHVIDFMKQGCELRNHGAGWYIFPPATPYAKQKIRKVKYETVESMKEEEVIVVEIIYNHARAFLTDKGESYSRNRQ